MRPLWRAFLCLFLFLASNGNAEPAEKAFSFRWQGQNALTRCGNVNVPPGAWPQPGSPGCYTVYLSPVKDFPLCQVSSFPWTDGGVYEERSGCGVPTEAGFYVNGQRGGFPLYQKKIWGYVYRQPSKTICDVTLDFEDGFLCAIKPSNVDPATRDTYYSPEHSTPEDRFYGFGYHVVVFPKTGTKVKGVYVHFKGSYGRPYSQSTKKFPDKTFLKESASSGYLMIQIAYANRYAINEDECGMNKSLEDCAGRVREDKITGVALSASDLVGFSIDDTPLADSVEYRLKKLKIYLEDRGFRFPVQFVAQDKVLWSTLRVGGLSQGSGMAAYIAKNFGVEHACILAGIHDTSDEDTPGGGPSANWLLEPGSKTSLEKQKAVLCEDDPSVKGFRFGLSLLGVSYKEESFAGGYFDEDGKAIDAHEAAVQDPRFKTLRGTACFAD